MGLSVGGIHVRTGDHARVIKAIKVHWLTVGAQEMTADDPDPLLLEPLSVAKTGKLGYAVWPASKDHEGADWVAVYDSERYHGSDELARYLATTLDALVVIYSFVSTVDEAVMSVYRGRSKQPGWYEASDDWGEIETAITPLPFGLTYYNQLRGHPLAEIGNPSVFGFEAMPYRKTGYRGPSLDESRAAARLTKVTTAIQTGDHGVVSQVFRENKSQRADILRAIVNAAGAAPLDVLPDKTRPSPHNLVLGYADELLADADAYGNVRQVAIAAFLLGDTEAFDRAIARLGRRVGGLDVFAHQLLRAKHHARSIDVYRVVVNHDDALLSAWNNLAHALSQVPELPADTAELLARADAHGMASSYIFHNTACTWVRLGDHDRALDAVRGAVRAGYPELARMRVDPDLAPLFDDPRYAEAYAAPVTVSFDEPVATKSHERTKHGVGVHEAAKAKTKTKTKTKTKAKTKTKTKTKAKTKAKRTR